MTLKKRSPHTQPIRRRVERSLGPASNPQSRVSSGDNSIIEEEPVTETSGPVTLKRRRQSAAPPRGYPAGGDRSTRPGHQSRSEPRIGS